MSDAQASAPVFDMAARRFYSSVLLWAAPVPIMFGWFFWEAGTGPWLVASGLFVEFAAIALAPTRRRAAVGVTGAVVACWPLLFVVVWFALGRG